MIALPTTPGAAWLVSFEDTTREPGWYPLAAACAVKSVLRSTRTVQGD